MRKERAAAFPRWFWPAFWIVPAAALILASLLPSLLPATCGQGNDWAAAATLRGLAAGQAECRLRVRIDVDSDGVGEYGTLAELMGLAGIRRDPVGASRGPESVSPAFAPTLTEARTGGIFAKTGYLFRIHLPGKGGGMTHEGRPGDPLTGPVDTDAAEGRWSCYAWPQIAGASGRRAFYVDASGEVWCTLNEDRRYSGDTAVPAWDAAVSDASRPVPLPAGPVHPPQYLGRDGNPWKRWD